MSKISTHFDQATNLSLGVLNDVLNPVVIGYAHSIAHNGGSVADVIVDACLQSRRLCAGHKV